MSDSCSDGEAPSQQRNADRERALRLAMRQIANEQDVEVPALHKELLCHHLGGEPHSGLLAEVRVWLDPSMGTQRSAVEELVLQHLHLTTVLEHGEHTTTYAIPNDPSYASLTLEYGDKGLLDEYHFLRR